VIVVRGGDVRAFGPKRPGNIGGLPCSGEQYLREWPGWELASQMQRRQGRINPSGMDAAEQRSWPSLHQQKKAAEAKARQPVSSPSAAKRSASRTGWSAFEEVVKVAAGSQAARRTTRKKHG
jgi:hypothetical protein